MRPRNKNISKFNTLRLLLLLTFSLCLVAPSFGYYDDAITVNSPISTHHGSLDIGTIINVEGSIYNYKYDYHGVDAYPTVCDADNDGYPEVVTYQADKGYVTLLNYDGEDITATDYTYNNGHGVQDLECVASGTGFDTSLLIISRNDSGTGDLVEVSEYKIENGHLSTIKTFWESDNYTTLWNNQDTALSCGNAEGAGYRCYMGIDKSQTFYDYHDGVNYVTVTKNWDFIEIYENRAGIGIIEYDKNNVVEVDPFDGYYTPWALTINANSYSDTSASIDVDAPMYIDYNSELIFATARYLHKVPLTNKDYYNGADRDPEFWEDAIFESEDDLHDLVIYHLEMNPSNFSDIQAPSYSSAFHQATFMNIANNYFYDSNPSRYLAGVIKNHSGLHMPIVHGIVYDGLASFNSTWVFKQTSLNQYNSLEQKGGTWLYTHTLDPYSGGNETPCVAVIPAPSNTMGKNGYTYCEGLDQFEWLEITSTQMVYPVASGDINGYPMVLMHNVSDGSYKYYDVNLQGGAEIQMGVTDSGINFEDIRGFMMFADLDNNGFSEILVSSDDGTYVGYLEEQEVTTGYMYYPYVYDYYTHDQCIDGVDVTYKMRECTDTNFLCTYNLSDRQKAERIVTSCGGTQATTYGAWSNDNPSISCTNLTDGLLNVSFTLQVLDDPARDTITTIGTQSILMDYSSDNSTCNPNDKYVALPDIRQTANVTISQPTAQPTYDDPDDLWTDLGISSLWKLILGLCMAIGITVLVAQSQKNMSPFVIGLVAVISLVLVTALGLIPVYILIILIVVTVLLIIVSKMLGGE